MIKTYNFFLNESTGGDINIWAIGKGISDGVDINNCICKVVNNYYQFILPYSSLFYKHKQYPRCWSMASWEVDRIIQNRYSCVKNASERLKSILDIEVFSDDAVDYLDLTDTNDTISFLPKARVDIIGDEDPYSNNYRQEMKIGRFFMKHTLLDITKIQLPVIEKLTNVYKSINDGRLNKNDIEIVKGEDIRFWFNGKNYSKGSGSLNKSCMKAASKSKLFDIYVNNPEVCRMAIKRDEKNPELIVGRALVWNTDKGVFMDRIYTTKDHYAHSFIGFCEKNGWMLRDNTNKDLSIQLNDMDYGGVYDNPFLDTFKYLDINKKKLYNHRPSNYSFILLDNF